MNKKTGHRNHVYLHQVGELPAAHAEVAGSSSWPGDSNQSSPGQIHGESTAPSFPAISLSMSGLSLHL